eukprot:gnl/Chilomastix_cuspidata/344.p2 GENE.gnl/Chilomastix_cuspidata/344~~gnl/Chilomastix_cuspidata/344.p2  ORF type:complete len:107 (-),score=47.69 gnl/Chilomastix_cuspidata/344:20-340(-)
MPDCRVTLRRKHAYNTRSNKVRVIRTPGGRYRVLYTKKIVNAPHCADTGAVLAGIPRVSGKRLSKLTKRQKHVSRPYGGKLSHAAVRDRILRAFLIEETKAAKGKQ